jgi:serine/threonine-protein kinase
MAPEQAKPHSDVGPAADVWAVGVVAYECLTGTRPFFAQDIPSLFDRIEHCTYTPAKERNPALPDAFDEWFRRTCAPDPRKRFPNASAATLALIDVLDIQSTITMGDPESSHAVLLRGPQSLSIPRLPRELSLTPGASSAPDTSERRRSHKPAMLGVAVVLALGLVAGAWLHRQAPSTPTTPSATSEPSMTTATDAAPVQNPVVEAASAAAPASASSAPPPFATPTATATTAVPRTKPSADATGGKVHVDGPATGDAVPPPPKETTKPPETSPPRTTPASPFELPELGL